jgi:organic hydroperoxide reductase OsmC/OhrA
MAKNHIYNTTINWKGNTGLGTKNYASYERSFDVLAENKTPIQGSSDPSFRGDKTKFNPEELLLASLSSCHMLWYLHLCSENNVQVLSYQDDANGIMQEFLNGSGKFIEVNLKPTVTVLNEGMIDVAIALHNKAHELCFIANSVNFTVNCNPTINIAEQ